MENIGIANYRSFDNNGVILEKLKKINIIIGKNNSGKSNFLRFFNMFNKFKGKLAQFPDGIEIQHKRVNKPVEVFLLFDGVELIHDARKGAMNFTAHIKAEIENFIQIKHRIRYNISNQKCTNIEEVFGCFVHTHSLIPFQRRLNSANRDELFKSINEEISQKIQKELIFYFKNLIYIPHFRIIKEGQKIPDSNTTIDGSNIISQMFQMQNPKVGSEKDKEKFLAIQTLVRDLIGKDDLSIEIPHDQKEMIINLDDNRFGLDYFGTGIHQMILICSILTMHEKCVVCLEEPEIHLHPELQRKFLNFLGTTDHTYFITSHSNVFLEYRDYTSIYHVANDGVRSTVTQCITNAASYSLLNDMGYKASDLLQANGIIWVEGPSDRNYINAWISLHSSNLIEGIHYSIMFYGGRLLANVSFDTADEIEKIIPLLKVNRNAFVVMDRDGFDKDAKLNKTKRRVRDELGDSAHWVTKGKEIENYLDDISVNKWLGKSTFQNNLDSQFGRKVAGIDSKKKYNNNKTAYSEAIAKYFDENSLDVLDLKKQIQNLVKNIDKWNGHG